MEPEEILQQCKEHADRAEAAAKAAKEHADNAETAKNKTLEAHSNVTTLMQSKGMPPTQPVTAPVIPVKPRKVVAAQSIIDLYYNIDKEDCKNYFKPKDDDERVAFAKEIAKKTATMDNPLAKQIQQQAENLSK